MAAYTEIDNPELYFQTVLYTGSGSAGKAVTLDGDEDMQPDLVWIKQRDSRDHFLFDAINGATKYVAPNTTAILATDANTLTSFDSDGFTLGNGVGVNESSDTHVAWCWKESADAGMDLVTYTGNGTAGNTFSHSLSAVPHFVICKIISGEVAEWYTYNASLGNTKNIFLHTTNAVSTSNLWWNATTPSSSVVTLGDQTGNNGNARNFMAYCFAPKQGFSKFGKYLANNNADGNFIYLGFRPAFFMVKSASGGSADQREWRIYDNKRSAFNEMDDQLYPSSSTGEAVNDNELDFLSNGVKIRCNDGGLNTSGETYIWMAFAEQPFVNSNGVPCNAR